MKFRARQSPAFGLLQGDADYLAEICERYVDGESLSKIAGDIDIPVGTLRDALVRAGVTMRPVGRYAGH